MRFQPSSHSNYGAEDAIACEDTYWDCCHGRSGTLWWTQPRCYGVSKEQCEQWETACQLRYDYDEEQEMWVLKPDPDEPSECVDTWTDCEGFSGKLMGLWWGSPCYNYRTRCNCHRGRNEDGTCKRPPFYQRGWFAPTLIVGGLAVTIAVVKRGGQKKLIAALRKR
jgi:hypothetical protein